MKSINFFLVITALLLICNTGFAQSTKASNKAIKSTDKLDNQLKSENPALALTEDQREQIVALQTQRMEDISVFRKSNSNKDEIKAKTKELNKAMNAKISKDILTPEQVEAKKAYRKKMKGMKGKAKKGKGKKGKGVAKADKASKKKAGKKPKQIAEKMTEAEIDEIYATATDKDKKRAEKATEKLNATITASDASLALSADQKKQINALNLKRVLERSKMSKAGASKEEIKAKSKELARSNKSIIKSILTKEQNAAQKAAPKKSKKSKG